jgi:putative phage-type endonuclease
MTEQELKRRQKYAGASDAAAILGLCPWRSQWHVWMDKVKGERQRENDNMRDGLFLEPAILSWAEHKLDATFTRQVWKAHDNGIMAATFDGLGDTYVVEAKWKANQLDTADPSECFGRAGSNQIPQNYLIQVCHQLYVAGPQYTTAYLAVLRGWGGLGFGMYKIKRDNQLCEAIAAKVCEWWTKHVVGGVEPQKPTERSEAA